MTKFLVIVALPDRVVFEIEVDATNDFQAQQIGWVRFVEEASVRVIESDVQVRGQAATIVDRPDLVDVIVDVIGGPEDLEGNRKSGRDREGV
jgi:hypothetical protein